MKKKLSNLKFLTLARGEHFRLQRRMLGVACCALYLVLSLSEQAMADQRTSFCVIVHPEVTSKSLESRFVADVFLKKITRWDGGQAIHPVDLPSSSKTRQLFSEQVIKRSVTAVRNYWQQRIFSGRDVPPPEVDSEKLAIKFVSSHAGAIGYVACDLELSGVKSVIVR